MTDGWTQSPSGWNLIDSMEYDDHLTQDDLDDYDQEYLLVLAGGLDHLGRNHPWVKDRLDIANRLYQMKRRRIIILGGGTYHKPPHLNRDKFVIHESTMGAKYLIDQGVDPDDIYREWSSYDTIANALFSLLNFVVPCQPNSVLVITSDFHMSRSQMIFQWIYRLWNEDHSIPEMKFLGVSTEYLDKDIIDARSQREMRSIENLRVTIDRLDTWTKFYDWFYREHQAYNCRFQAPPTEQLDERVRSSY